MSRSKLYITEEAALDPVHQRDQVLSVVNILFVYVALREQLVAKDQRGLWWCCRWHVSNWWHASNWWQ
jgi:hypothetical protein